MSIEDPRAVYVEEARRTADATPTAADAGVETVSATGESAQRRIAAMDALRTTALSRHDVIAALGGVLADPDDDAAVRAAALEALQAVSFAVADFARYAADYRAALAVTATASDEGLRDRALEILAQHKDEYAQRLLSEGLRDASVALVSRARALQLLGQDLHAQDQDLVREIAETSQDPEERLQALRCLAATGPFELFRRIVEDKAEDARARATGVAALQAQSPDDFSDIASRIALDNDDYDDVRALVMTALAVRPASAPADLGDRVLEAAANIDTPQLDAAAQRYRDVRSART